MLKCLFCRGLRRATKQILNDNVVQGKLRPTVTDTQEEVHRKREYGYGMYLIFLGYRPPFTSMINSFSGLSFLIIDTKKEGM